MNSIIKKVLSLLIVLSVMFIGVKSFERVNAEVTETNVYTFATIANSGNNAYASNYEVTITDIKWNVPGNQSFDGYVRIGGKQITNVDRIIYSKNPINYDIKKIVIKDNGKTNPSLTVNSITFSVYGNAEDAKNGTNAISTFVLDYTPAVSTSHQEVIVCPNDKSWKNAYYRYVINVTNSVKTNYGFDLNCIEFYTVEDNNGPFEVSFDANDGTGDAPASLEVAKGETSAALPANTFTKAGYVFAGWNTQADGNGTTYNVGETISNVCDDIILYAMWELDSSNYVTVTFNNNLDPADSYTQAIEKDVATALTLNTFVSTKGFARWNTEADGEGTSYTNGQEVNLDEDLTLYAQWENYSIADVMENGVVGNQYTISGEITSIISNSNATIQDASGAILIYDYKAVTGTSAPAFVLGDSVTLTGEYALYNNKGELKNLTNISVLSSNGKVDTTPITSCDSVKLDNAYKYVELSSLYITSVSSSSYIIEGCNFKLKSISDDYVGKDLLQANSYVNIKGVINIDDSKVIVTVYSVTSVPQYTITYNSDGGTSVASQSVLEGNSYSEPTAPTHKSSYTTKYTFAGWYYSENEVETPVSFTNIYNKNIDAYAKWDETPISTYTLMAERYTKANLMFDYSGVSAIDVVSESFVGSASGSKTLPTGWSGTVGGTYASPYWQSFRNNGQNVVSPVLTKNGLAVVCNKVTVSLKYYLNNTGSSGNKSSKLLIKGLRLNPDYDSNDSNSKEYIDIEGCSAYSPEINTLTTGSANSVSLSVVLDGGEFDIDKVSISLVKDGGGNVAFSNVKINSDTYGYKNASLQFAGRFDSAFYDELINDGSVVSFGMIYGVVASKDTYKLNDINGKTDAQLSDIFAVLDRKECSPVGVSSDGMSLVDENPEYYQFGVSINNIPYAHINDSFVAFAYVCVDGVYYVMNSSYYSVVSIANYYVNLKDTSAFSEHLDALNWLAFQTL